VPGSTKKPWYFGSNGTLLKRAAARGVFGEFAVRGGSLTHLFGGLALRRGLSGLDRSFLPRKYQRGRELAAAVPAGVPLAPFSS